MADNLVCSEADLAIALNKTNRCIEFLQENISVYAEVLKQVSASGIIDNKIDIELTILSEKLKVQKLALIYMQSKIGKSVKKEIQNIEKVDKFVYPNISLSDVVSVLTSFL